MEKFPRTIVGGVNLPRLIVGTNWFLGYSHYSAAKDDFIRKMQTAHRIADILEVFLSYGVEAVMGPPDPLLSAGVHEAEQRSGQPVTLILTPSFNILPGGSPETEPEAVIAECKKMGATFCMPHQCVTDAILDRMHRNLRGMDTYSTLIRQYEMIPGLSTHLPETVVIADESSADVETYIQIYNAAGFLMPVEADWALRVIQKAKKPVMTIKPLAAGRLLPIVGLTFVWNTLREQDMVTIGTTTPEEAREVLDLSLDLLTRRTPDQQLQRTRSKTALEITA